MAEFQEVMKQWRRMCERFSSQGACAQFCPICANPVCGELKDASDEQIARAEAEIMQWAAKHPEPVYPTWGDYLISKGLLMPYWNERGTAPYDMYIYAERALANHIPADIAEKLGLEPKEG